MLNSAPERISPFLILAHCVRIERSVTSEFSRCLPDFVIFTVYKVLVSVKVGFNVFV